MILTFEFSIPKQTPATTPIVQIFDMGVNAGVIKSINVLIPEGHKGLARMRAYIPGTPLIPAQGSGTPYIRGENTEIKAAINKVIPGPPYNLYCEGYNEDSFLPHTFIINLEC